MTIIRLIFFLKKIQSIFLFSVKFTPEPINLFLVSTHEILIKTKELIDTPISIYYTNQTIYGMNIFILFYCVP